MLRTNGARGTRLGSRMSTARPLTKNCSERIRLYRPNPLFASGWRRRLSLGHLSLPVSLFFTWLVYGLTSNFKSFVATPAVSLYSPRSAALHWSSAIRFVDRSTKLFDEA